MIFVNSNPVLIEKNGNKSWEVRFKKFSFYRYVKREFLNTGYSDYSSWSLSNPPLHPPPTTTNINVAVPWLVWCNWRGFCELYVWMEREREILLDKWAFWKLCYSSCWGFDHSLGERLLQFSMAANHYFVFIWFSVVRRAEHIEVHNFNNGLLRAIYLERNATYDDALLLINNK